MDCGKSLDEFEGEYPHTVWARRQVLSVFAPDDNDVVVWLIDGQESIRQTTLAALLPDIFGHQHLQ